MLKEKSSKIIDFPKNIIFENALDPHHVETVHKNTIKRCDILVNNGDMSILIYELYVFPVFKFLNFTKKFLVIKEKKGDSRVSYISLPLSLKFVSKLEISLKEIDKNKTKYDTIFTLTPFSFIYKVFSKLIMKLRSVGDKVRLDEDLELIKYRYESINNLHEDKPKCLDRKTLEDEWF